MSFSSQNPQSKADELKNRLDENDEYVDGYLYYMRISYKKRNDYSYIDFYKKAFDNAKNLSEKKRFYSEIVYEEAHRDYHKGSIKEFKALKQIGVPDHELKEAKCELFKISMSDIVRDGFAGKFNCKCLRYCI